MKITLYKTNSSSNTIGKILSNPVTLNINLKSDTDIVRPNIRISGIENIEDFNYLHIPDLKRYYFINDIQTINNKIVVLMCECDVLETYKIDILNSKSRYNRNIKNGDYVDVNVESEIIENISMFESDVTIENDKSLILTTVGI